MGLILIMIFVAFVFVSFFIFELSNCDEFCQFLLKAWRNLAIFMDFIWSKEGK